MIIQFQYLQKCGVNKQKYNKYRQWVINMNMKQNNQSKQQLFIGATVQPIQNCQLLAGSDDSILFISKRSLIVMNLAMKTLKSCLIGDQKISSATYYAKLQVFIINTDRYLLIVNKQAEIISNQRIPQLLEAKSLIIIQMQDGYQGIPYQRKDLILFFTNQYLFQATILIKYERSLLKSKSLCSMHIQLTEKPQIVHFEWTAQFANLIKIKLLICWNQTQAYVFETPRFLGQKLNLTLYFDKILRKNKLYESQNKMNSFQASLKHKLLLVSFQLGSIKVYKLDQTKKYISELKGHQRECISLLIPEANPDLLYSCGLDNSVRIWELIDFGQVYHVRFDVICSQVLMLNEKLIFAKSLDNRRALFVKLNIELLKPILSEAKSGRIVNLACDGEWGITLYSNNFVQAFLLGNYENQNRQFTQKIQFPIKYGFLRSSIKLKEDTFAVCMQKGFSLIKLNKKQSQGQNFQLKRLVYNHTLETKPNQKGQLIQIIHEKLLDSFFFTMLQDWKNIPLAINVTSVSFILNQAVPKWDIEIKAKQSQGKSDYIILGNDKGYIFFIDIKRRTHYYTKVFFHSDSVINVQKITINNFNQLSFISIAATKEIVIWWLSQKKCPTILTRLTYQKDVSLINPAECFLSIGYHSGQFNILQLDYQTQKQQIQFKQCQKNKQEGHLKMIVAIDFIKFKGKNVWLTGGEDYAIKIWRGVEKQLVLQVRVFSGVNNVIFAKRDLDILLSHGENGQISVLTAKNIQQIQTCKANIQKDDNEETILNTINIKTFFSPIIQETNYSPRKNAKEAQKILNQNSGKRNQMSQLIKNRVNDKLDVNFHSSLQKKSHTKREFRYQRNFSPVKNTDSINNSIILPKISNKKSYLDSSSYVYESKMKQSSILQKIQNSRVKSFSHAGKMNI